MPSKLRKKVEKKNVRLTFDPDDVVSQIEASFRLIPSVVIRLDHVQEVNPGVAQVWPLLI